MIPIKDIFDMLCSIQIKSWAIKLVEKQNLQTSLIDCHRTRGQFETTGFNKQFQSGDLKLEISLWEILDPIG